MPRKTIPLAESVKRTLDALAKKNKATVSVGWINSNQAPIAFWNEFGHKGRFPAPARPFFRPMVARESPQWGPKMASLMRGGLSGASVLGMMGQHISEQLQRSIINTNEPPLSLVTRRLRKKFGMNTQNIRARDVLQARDELARVMVPTRKGTARRMPALVSGTGAKPLVWTGQMIRSVGYSVNGGPVALAGGK